MRGLGSDNVDFRLRQSDFSRRRPRAGVPWLGMKIAEINKLDRVLVVGSFLRKDHPLLSRSGCAQAAKRGCKVNVLHAVDDDLLMPVANKVDRRAKCVGRRRCAEIAVAIAQRRGESRAGRRRRRAATSAQSDRRSAAWRASARRSCSATLPSSIRRRHSCTRGRSGSPKRPARRSGFWREAANSVGGYLAGAVPERKAA